ncbi:MAG: chitobiase/beta-hexosaminidase C-terminal domain-containing protein [Candidatus Obscuribacterales bacterium]|nr:chitobiase/beta-hexosaminidase C-terminal domain-containing protein [Candidatus Obscuribacterales bacterium]
MKPKCEKIRKITVRIAALQVVLTMLLCAGPVRAQSNEIVPNSSHVRVVSKVRFFPAPGHEQELVNGKFSGSNSGDKEDFHVLGKIEQLPPPGKWSELSFANAQPYRFVRFESPRGSYCQVAELEFYADDFRLRGLGFCSTAANERAGNWKKAFDGNTGTYTKTELPDDQFIGVDFGESCSCRTPVLSPGPGTFPTSIRVSMSSGTAGAIIKYTTDGSLPSSKNGKIYSLPLEVNATQSLSCIAFKDGLAPSLPRFGVFKVGKPNATMYTLHIGNSLTNSTKDLPLFASTVGIDDNYYSYTHGGATTQIVWEDAVDKRKDVWTKTIGELSRIDHFTLQPRDFNIAREAQYDQNFLNIAREISPSVKTWLYAEWVEYERKRPTDLGTEASPQMKRVWPALTWEESMAAMLLYVEDLQAKLAADDKVHEPPRIIPAAIVMGWMHHFIDEGKVSGMPPGSFNVNLFDDTVHPNAEGRYLVDMTWLSAFTAKPLADVAPLGTKLTSEQAKIMRDLSWEIVSNYPGSGLFRSGSKRISTPRIIRNQKLNGTTVNLRCATPGVLFRYTVDGSTPSREHGYIYCGVISLQPGMQLKVLALKSGMAESKIVSCEDAP